MIKQEAARQIVSAGLEQRRQLRQEAEREARQEAYEKEMILACNLHCADARKGRESRERDAKRRAERAQARAKAVELEFKSVSAVRYYGILCLVVLLVSAVTRLPFWAAAALIAGGAIFPAVYIYRLYNPIER